MIEIKNMYEDLRSDQVGQAINALRSKSKWNSEKYRLRDLLFDTLNKNDYTKSAGTRANFLMTGGIGFSYLYRVPSRKRGRFSKFTDKLIRLVYVASAKNYLEIRFAVVSENQIGRSFLSICNKDSILDPRIVFNQVIGELGYNPSHTNE